MKLRITLKTPLNIGSGRELNKGEYVIFNNRLLLINETELFRILEKNNLIKPFMEEVEKNMERFSLKDFLKNKDLLKTEILEKISLYSIKLKKDSEIKKGRLRIFIKDAFLRPFIPGSSIKGAIRVALLYSFLNKDENFKNRFIRSVEGIVGEYLNEFKIKKGKILKGKNLKDFQRNERNKIRKKINEIKKKLKKDFEKKYLSPDKEILENFILNSENKNPHTDLLRCLKISDSLPLDRNKLSIAKIEFLTFGGKKDIRFDYPAKLLRIPLISEVLDEGSVIEFEVKFDTELFKEIKSRNSENKFLKEFPDDEKSILEFILNEVRGFYKNIYNLQIKKLNSVINGLKIKLETFDANFRFGFGGGLESVSLFSILPFNLRKNILELFFDEIRVERRFYPNHIKLIKIDENKYSLLGWAKIELMR